MITLFQHQQQALMDAMRYGLEDMKKQRGLLC